MTFFPEEGPEKERHEGKKSEGPEVQHPNDVL